MENAVARRGVIGRRDVVQAREFASDRRLPVVVVPAGEDEMIVRDGGLTREHRVPACNLVERVNRERRRPVRRGEQVGIDAQRDARPHHIVRAFVNAVGPHNLLGGCQAAGGFGIGPLDARHGVDRACELAPAGGEDASRAANLVFLRRQRNRLVCFLARLIGQPPRLRLEAELVAIARVRHRLGTLDDVETEIQRVTAEDIAHVVATDDNHLEAGLFGNRLQAGRTHLARRSNGEPIAGDDERLAAVDASAKVGHQVAERPGLPALVEGVEALGHAVGRRRNLIGVDRVELSGVAGTSRIPEDERPSMNHGSGRGLLHGCGSADPVRRDTVLEPGGLYGLHVQG